MDVVVLGSGGAFRLPYLGCHCPNCEAARRELRLRRTTTSLWVHQDGASILLDAGPDLYHQALREGIERLDGIFLTHAHRDHSQGIECLETIVRYGREGQPLPIFGPADAVESAAAQFEYMVRLGFIEVVALRPGVPAEFQGFRIRPFEVAHHHITTFGYRVECGEASLVYVPDIKSLPGGEPLASAPLPPEMVDASLFFVDATFDETDWVGPGHITWQEAAALGVRSGARCTVLVHLSHRVNLTALRQATGEHLREGYDGQRFSL